MQIPEHVYDEADHHEQVDQFMDPEGFRKWLVSLPEDSRFCPLSVTECPISEWAKEVLGVPFDQTSFHADHWTQEDLTNPDTPWYQRYYLLAGPPGEIEWDAKRAEEFLDLILNNELEPEAA